MMMVLKLNWFLHNMNSGRHQLILVTDLMLKMFRKLETKEERIMRCFCFLVCEVLKKKMKNKQKDGDRYSFQMLENKRHGSCFVV